VAKGGKGRQECAEILKGWIAKTMPSVLVFALPVTGERFDNFATACNGLIKLPQVQGFSFHDLSYRRQKACDERC
jgi:hypothetical protein